MRRILKGTVPAIAFGGFALIGGAAVPARADEMVVICSAALAEPMTAAACAATGVVLHELLVADRPFGPNGELMRVLVSPVTIIDGNIRGAVRESGELAKVLRGTTGISIRDVERHGLFGGPNSIFRKPFG